MVAALPSRCKFLEVGLPSSRKRELKPAANAEEFSPAIWILLTVMFSKYSW